MPTTETKQTRLSGLQSWGVSMLRSLGHAVDDDFRLLSASDDASFRRYFRGIADNTSYILVDAPPDKEDNESFVTVYERLSDAGVLVPKIFAADMQLGYLLLSDLGDRLLLPQLKKSSAADRQNLYMSALKTLEGVLKAEGAQLPPYDADRLATEISLFPDWFVTRQLELPMDAEARAIFRRVNELLINNALAQPTVFVHRDFHARNLMLQEDGQIAVIDFQDAVVGPVTYDLVSLLKDCYWRLPRSTVLTLVEYYRQRVMPEIAADEFVRWFDLMGFQRHLKCAGIFSRLSLRDGKPGYLKDIPLVIAYLLEVTDLYHERYPELGEFGDWLRQNVEPAMKRHLS
jgi:aminoglycoside/choline kinase family phosphotransferase